MRTINYGLTILSQGNFIIKVSFIIFCCQGNLNFSAFPIDISAIDAKLTAYKLKLVASKTDHLAVKEALKIRKEIEAMLKKNALYINDVAEGDEIKLESSGYDLSKEREFKIKPEVDVVQSNQPGCGKVFIRPIEDVVAYLAEICKDPLPGQVGGNTWQRLPMSTRSYMPVSGIEHLKLYYVKYCTLTTEGESAYSELFKFSFK